MKKLILIFVLAGICLGFSSCDTGQRNQKNIALIERYVKAVESKDVETMASLLHDDYMGYGPSLGDSTNKAQAVENWKHLSENYYEEINYDDFQNIAVSINEGLRKGDWVSNWALLTLKFKDGRGPVKLYVNVVYRIEDDQIIHSRTFYNEADVLRQLGYTFN